MAAIRTSQLEAFRVPLLSFAQGIGAAYRVDWKWAIKIIANDKSKGNRNPMTKIPVPGTPVRGSRSGSAIMALFDLLGRRWAMGVLWTLRERGPSTFRELEAACESISPAVLNTRLKELRLAGLVERDEGGYVVSAMGDEIYKALLPLSVSSKKWARMLIKTLDTGG